VLLLWREISITELQVIVQGDTELTGLFNLSTEFAKICIK